MTTIKLRIFNCLIQIIIKWFGKKSLWFLIKEVKHIKVQAVHKSKLLFKLRVTFYKFWFINTFIVIRNHIVIESEDIKIIRIIYIPFITQIFFQLIYCLLHFFQKLFIKLCFLIFFINLYSFFSVHLHSQPFFWKFTMNSDGLVTIRKSIIFQIMDVDI